MSNSSFDTCVSLHGYQCHPTGAEGLAGLGFAPLERGLSREQHRWRCAFAARIVLRFVLITITRNLYIEAFDISIRFSSRLSFSPKQLPFASLNLLHVPR